MCNTYIYVYLCRYIYLPVTPRGLPAAGGGAAAGSYIYVIYAYMYIDIYMYIYIDIYFYILIWFLFFINK